MAAGATTEELKPFKDAANAARQAYWGKTSRGRGAGVMVISNVDGARAVHTGMIEKSEAAIQHARSELQSIERNIAVHIAFEQEAKRLQGNMQVADQAYLDAGGHSDNLQRQFITNPNKL